MKETYKIGDKVILLKFPEGQFPCFVQGMETYVGIACTISEVYLKPDYNYNVYGFKEHKWCWPGDHLLPTEGKEDLEKTPVEVRIFRKILGRTLKLK